MSWTPFQSPNIVPYLRKKLGEELVVAIIWQVAHPNTRQTGDFKNFYLRNLTADEQWSEDFFKRLNLDFPGLEKVKAAIETSNIELAKIEYINYMKARQSPSLQDLPQSADETIIKNANNYAKRLFDFPWAKPVQWGDKPQWEANPPNYEQWTVGNNRHKYFLDLGRAYAKTKNEKYAKEYVFQATHFASNYPYYIGDKKPWFLDGPIIEAGRINLSLNAGNRMGSNWWPAYYYFRNSPNFSVEQQMVVLRCMLEHADYILDERLFDPKGNWAAFETNGLFHLAVLMPEFKDAELWKKTAIQRYEILLKTLVYPDGTPKEISMGYHWGNTTFFSESLKLAQANNVLLPQDFKNTIMKMYEAGAYSTRSNFGMVGFGDANWAPAGDRFKVPHKLFPEHPHFEFFATLGESGNPPDFVSWHSPWAGWYCMRTGWTKNDNYLVLDAGPIGASHYHADKLGIVVHIGDKMVLHETSNYSYDGSPMQHYIRGTWAHNTIVVNEKIQRSYGMKHHFTTNKPLDNRWYTDDQFDFADGLYNLGFADIKVDYKVDHRREILFVKPNYWIVVDHLNPKDELEHDYRALFHMSPGRVQIDDTNSPYTEWEDGGFRVMPVRKDDINLSIVRGQEEPYLLGWVPGGSQKKRPSTVAVFQWKAKGPTTQAWILTPRNEQGQWAVNRAFPNKIEESGNLDFFLDTIEGGAKFTRKAKVGERGAINWTRFKIQ